MYPVLFSIGSFHLYAFSIVLVLAWCVFSFVFWRGLRNEGVEDDRIFDLTFYATIVAFIVARAAYVGLHWETFSDSWLRMVAIWVSPGLSWYGALFGGLTTLVYLSRQYKVRLGHVLDAFAPAYSLAAFVGVLGAFLDGTYVGTLAGIPWAIRYVGHVGLRHPVQLYEAIVLLLIFIALRFLGKKAKRVKWPYGLVGLWFFFIYTSSMFVLEFFKDTGVYLGHIRANQWVLVALWGETMGAFYVRGGGRERLRPFVHSLIGGIRGKFSKRSS